MKTSLKFILGVTVFVALIFVFTHCENENVDHLEKAQLETQAKLAELTSACYVMADKYESLDKRIAKLENIETTTPERPTDISELVNKVEALQLQQKEQSEDIYRLHRWHWWWVKHWGIDYKQIK